MENQIEKLKKLEKAREIGHRYGMALNEIESEDFGAAEGYAMWFDVHGYPEQASQIREKIPESEVEPEQRCNHASKSEREYKKNENPYGYHAITEIVCDHCGEVLDSERKYIKTQKPKTKAELAKEMIPEPESEVEPEPEPEVETETEVETKTEPEPEYPGGEFKARINKKLFKAWVEPMKALSDEIKANITKSGISVKLVDAAHVAMLATEIDRKAFDEYKASDFELGMDLDKIATNLRKGNQKKDAVISLEYDQNKGKIVLANGVNERTMAIIDTAGMSDPKVPNLDLPNKITVDTKTVFEALKECSEVSDYARLTNDSEGFTIDAEDDTDNASAHISKAQLHKLDAREKEISLFPLDYLETMVKAIKSNTITLIMGTDYPLVIEWEIENQYDSKKVDIKGKYLLAPRIESDE